MISREMMGAYIPMLHNQFKEQMNRLVGKIDLTTSQIHVLFYLKSRGDEEVIQKDIEEKFNLTNPTVTGIIKRLEAKGFVTRTVSSKDARSKSIHLTEKSIAASKEMKRALQEANKKSFRRLHRGGTGCTGRMLQKDAAQSGRRLRPRACA